MRHDLGFGVTAALVLASFAAAWTAQPPRPIAGAKPAGPIVILMELSPPDPGQAAWVYRDAPPAPTSR